MLASERSFCPEIIECYFYWPRTSNTSRTVYWQMHFTAAFDADHFSLIQLLDY